MSVTACSGEMCSPLSSFQQQPSIADHGVEASWGRVWSGSPRRATSQFNFLSVAEGVAELCGPMATFTALESSSRNQVCGTRSSGGGQRQNKYDGAVGITRKLGSNSVSLFLTCCSES